MDRIKQINEWLDKRALTPLKEWAGKTSFPGFMGIPILDVFRLIYNELQEDDITVRANSMAFSFLLALFPLLILIFSLIPFLPNQNIQFYFEQIKALMERFLPEQSSSYLLQMLQDLLFNQRTGLLSFSVLLALYFASNGIMYMMIGFEKNYEDSFRSRNFISRRIQALGLTFLLGILFTGSFVLIFFSNNLVAQLVDWLNLAEYSLLINSVKWGTIIVLIYATIALLYRFGTNSRKKFKLFSPGTTLATVLSITSSLAFSYYVNNFSDYNKIYGSLGALIILMLWLQINAFILLVGFELNASIIMNRIRTMGNKSS
ncbi:MAG TPA: YihY/virulence factor BrkB family protein [Saprospiraceae bacterium]|nr:YihY/virulence factor BrkB family protein [Saprospiraceae bacterium]